MKDRKECARCKIEKGVEEFSKNKCAKDGLNYTCKECDRKYYQDNKKKILKRVMDNYNQFKDEEEFKNKKNKRGRKYYYKNKERIREKHREYGYRTREARREHKNNYRNERYRTNPILRLKRTVSTSIGGALKAQKGSKQGRSVVEFLPYTIKQLKEHIESLWEPWMNWDNHGVLDLNKKTWQIDHIVPHSFFNYDTMEHPDFKKCWALENLRPLEAFENLKKNNKLLEDMEQSNNE